ncbi:DUF4328 domain-containing protein [Streptomyces sp. NBC_00887]|uniref:DUF4328 domain-containing protein n=1 Tax=Streptomyces sp. NBC_00887 TaxID=2975859 RepID=UPI003862F2AF|nr:DUF4328 domain-containing protein [Streptomyces sp. NBC_00887]
MIITDILSIASGGYLYVLLRGLPDSAAALDAVSHAGNRQLYYDLAGMLQSLLYLSTGIVYVCWLYRLRDNAEVFAPGAHRRGRSWTGWCWLIPVVNLWFPRRVTLDIWNASRSAEAQATTSRPGHELINLWWGFWLAEGLFALVGGVAYEVAASIGQATAGIGLLAISDVFDIVCAVLALRLVRTLTHMQHIKMLAGRSALDGGTEGPRRNMTWPSRRR